MTQPIALGTVLGGRYQVTASLLTSDEDDHVLQGEDQILHRRVSILVPGAQNEQLVVSNARSLASGSGSAHFQILDLGQTDHHTYLVTSHASAADLLDTLLVAESELEDESLSDDIFGGSRSSFGSPYVYEEPDPTQPHQALAASEKNPEGAHAHEPDAGSDGGTSPEQPAVTRWDNDDFDSYENAPAAPSVRNKLGRARKVDPEATRSTLFDRAAADGSGAAVGASAAAVSKIDPTYDGDNRYESFEANEGKPERLTGYPVIEEETPAQSHSGAAASAEVAETADEVIDRGEHSGSSHPEASGPDRDDERDGKRDDARGSSASAGAAGVGGAAAGIAGAAATTGTSGGDTGAAETGAAPAVGSGSAAAEAGAAGAGVGAEQAGAADSNGADPDGAAPPRSNGTAESAPHRGERDAHAGADHEPRAATGSGAAAAEPAAKKRNGPLRALLLLLLILALIAAVVFGFRALGTLSSQFGDDDPEPAPQSAQPTSAPTQQTEESAEPEETSEPEPATPRVQSASRLTSDPTFMPDTDATLGQVTDDNPATYWLSYGFSTAEYGNLIEYAGLAVELAEPAPVSEITIDQSSGSGGNFTVYVSDSASLENATQVGTGSFTGPQITVPLEQPAQDGDHEYVLVVWDQLPQLTNPIGGYRYGLRIGEITAQ